MSWPLKPSLGVNAQDCGRPAVVIDSPPFSGNLPIQRQSNIIALIPYVVGGVLLVAALLKTQQMLAEIQPTNGDLFASRWVQIAAVEIEIFCGLALLLGFHLRVARRLCQVLFLVFLCVSIYHIAFGAESCGCFGAIQVGPAAALILDIVVIVALWFWRPAGDSTAVWARPWPALVALPVGLLLAWPWLSQAEATAPVQVIPGVIDLGSVVQAEKRQFVVLLRNSSDEVAVIDRLEFSCPCLSAAQSSWLLSPGQDTKAELELDLGKEPDFTGQLLLQLKVWAKESRRVFVAQVIVRVLPRPN
jgi:hypothetical protein